MKNPKTFYSLTALLRYADRIIDRYDTITIDLFDTIFIRRVHDPDMLKPAVARFISAMAKKRQIEGWPWKRVQALRDQLENEQRAQTAQHFVDHEARYPEFMSRVLHQIFQDQMSDELLAMVTDYELEIESAMIVPRSDLVTWIKKYAPTKTIIIVSDIYLPAAHLKRLVHRAGLLDHVVDVVSSADTFLAKASGKAFPLLQKKYNLSIDHWLHFGDNPFSDGLRPADFGIRSLVLKDIKEIQRKAIAKTYAKISTFRPFWRGRFLQQLMLPLESENIKRSELYIEGYNFLGFLLGFFTQHVLNKCLELEIEKVFFFSREGWTFKTFWDRTLPLMPHKELAPESHYLYVSRLALAGASCAYAGLSEEKAQIAFLPPGNRDMRDFCRVFSLRVAPFKNILDRFALSETAPISPLHSEKGYGRFIRMLANPEFQELIKTETRPLNDALQVYLESVGFFEFPKVALVDVGWMGNIQRFLYDAVKHRDDCPVFQGFLLAASRGVHYPASDQNRIEGVLYDRAWINDFAGSVMMYNRDLFEEACRAPHPSMVRYALDQNRNVRLVFRSDNDDYGSAESYQDHYFSDLRQGIFDAAARYGAASAVLGFSTDSLRAWLRYLLVSKLAFPKVREVSVIKHRHHMDDFGGRHKPPPKVTQDQKHLWDLPLWVLRMRPWLKLDFYLNKKRPQ